MKYIEAPFMDLEAINGPKEKNLFLAGSISGAVDWQAEIAPDLCKHCNVFNPRRANYTEYTELDPLMEREQITWEYFHINKVCGKILFWFSNETLAPITLFEYGKALATFDRKNIFVGVHPEYKRKNDVYIQTELACGPLKKIHKSLIYLKHAVMDNYSPRYRTPYTSVDCKDCIGCIETF